MELKIGYCVDDNRTIDKVFTVTETVEVKMKDSSSIINPVFILSTPSSLNINYCYCEEWDRYYYINNIDVMTGGRIAISCHVDVLKSNASAIKQLSCIIDKQENASESNMYKDDGSFVVLNKAQNQTINFPNGLNDNFEYVLVVAGA